MARFDVSIYFRCTVTSLVKAFHFYNLFFCKKKKKTNIWDSNLLDKYPFLRKLRTSFSPVLLGPEYFFFHYRCV
jgi:hypothetical protein